jgi:predicted Zn-dependent protease
VNAENALQRALDQRPSDPRLSYELARVLLQEDSDREAEAIPLLEDALKDPNAPQAAWMLLGYACLWDQNRLNRSIEASRKYLALRPDRPGALLNLACAYAQQAGLGSQTERDLAKGEAIKTLTELFKLRPDMKDRVVDLEDNDFKAIKDDPEFRRLLGK